ncbi:hypothetical protein RGQ15_17365 [Paracoccus sp. MBLB3053]|uniref:3-deoxy-manno-octulosonate cytidylyltransferase n=1 Tax=Paracoccus aurantius TaxID=3073814 RepID=A0ABU2HW98_9RHOB|nr:hypothetical protein [Paracoccus sp. MBLB3053]MDS9469334.1 hypothetical protein [Paracoccus sp. MBLB3053]
MKAKATGTAQTEPANSAELDRAARELFAGFSQIVLVANSDDSNVDQIARSFPEGTLFVFFNKVYKILGSSFTRPAMLVCRSGMMGANIVHRREVSTVLDFFDSSDFRGVLNIAIGQEERFSPKEAFEGAPVKHLHLGKLLSAYYPENKVPTTGFGLCMWLLSQDLPASIHLAGFSAKRSEQWKVFDVHDWTFEQVLIRLLYRDGKIFIHDAPRKNPYQEISEHFPQFSPATVALTTDEILSERMMGLSSVIDRLMSITKVLRYIDSKFRKIRPRTRKQKHIARTAAADREVDQTPTGKI